jgi:hypothetical protein
MKENRKADTHISANVMHFLNGKQALQALQALIYIYGLSSV